MIHLLIPLLLLTPTLQEAETDVIRLKDGRTLKGFILSEEGTKVEIEILVKSSKGKTIGTAKMTVAKSDILNIDRISDAARARARARAAEFRGRKRRLSEALKSIKVEPGDLSGKQALKTGGENFEIISTCDPKFLKEVTFYIEEVFTGYRKYFKITRNADTRIKIYLLSNKAEYIDFQRKKLGGAIMNPAFYSPEGDFIVAYNLIQKEEAVTLNEAIRGVAKQIGETKKAIRKEEKRIDKIVKDTRKAINDEAVRAKKEIRKAGGNDQAKKRAKVTRWRSGQLKKLKKAEKEYDAQLAKYSRACTRKIKELEKTIRHNRSVLRNQNKKMFELLFHEGFHSFVDQFLFESSEKVEVPRWLNEGMAMYFEMSAMESGELLHGGLHAEMTKLLKEKFKAGVVVPLRKILKGGPEAFLVTHEKDVDRSNLYYAESWALVHYLTGRLTQEQLEQYVSNVMGGAAKDDAFEKMLGKSVEKVEADLIEYVKGLK